MTRSPPPKIATKKVKQETDKTLLDIQQYLGGTHAQDIYKLTKMLQE